MTRNILESDEVDSKIFEGRVLSLLGEILQNQNSLRIAFEDAFRLPEEAKRKDRDTYDKEFEDEDDE